MRFHVTNRHNGQRYKAEGEHWPDHGWHVKIFDFAPDTWGRATTGIGPGPVIDQGWKQELEQRGYEFPPLTQPVDVRGQEMNRLAKLMQPPAPETPPATPQPPPTTEGKIDWSKRLAALRKRRCESKAVTVVAALLEDCVPGGSPEGERHDKRGIDPKELAMGRKVEREHTKGGPHAARAAEEIAIDHLVEPGHKKYYSKLKKSGLAHELTMPKPKGSFYPSSGGPSSV